MTTKDALTALFTKFDLPSFEEVYRDEAKADKSFTGYSWQYPKVREFQDVCAVLRKAAGLCVVWCLCGAAVSAQEPAPLVGRVAIVDSLGQILGPWWDGGTVIFVDGALLQNWAPGDATTHNGRWMVFSVFPGGFQTGGRLTYYIDSGCQGQPYMALAPWFQNPIQDFATRVFAVGDAATPETLTPRSTLMRGVTDGPCKAIAPRPDGTWAPKTLGTMLTFEAEDIGFVPPFHADVVSEQTGADSVATEQILRLQPPRNGRMVLP